MASSLRSSACPSGERRSQVTDFLFRATTGHHSDLPCGFSRPQSRIGSPPAGLFNLDHLGTEITEQLAAERPGQQLAELDDPQVAQWELAHDPWASASRPLSRFVLQPVPAPAPARSASVARALYRWLRMTASAQPGSRARAAATISR